MRGRTRTCRCLLLCLALWGPAVAAFGQVVEVAFPNRSFSRPVALQHAGDGRLFVVEQEGRIQVFEPDPAASVTGTFLDLRDRVLFGGEQGLLGLAFHPNYDENGFFFVDYVAANPRRTVVARFSVDPLDPDRADPNSEVVILEVGQPFSNHNGGKIAFGPDGFLYIGLGDGGSAGDPEGHGQNLTTPLGAILRIDVDHPGGGRNYGIPTDNPLVGALCGPIGCVEEIYAYGLRNPWRFSFDPETGRLWAGDVGQDAFEEIDLVEKGGNYGWNVMEGLHCFSPAVGCTQTGLALPVWEYDHTQGGSVTGGHVYRGPGVPELTGKYIYGDFVSGRLWALTYDGVTATNELLAETGLGIAAFGMDAAGELYFCAFDGRIYRFRSTVETGVDAASAPAFRLEAGYPDPFAGSTTIPYRLSRTAFVELVVYDALGRRVRTLVRGREGGGAHVATWDGRDAAGVPVPGGVYFYRLRVGDTFAATRRMVRLR